MKQDEYEQGVAERIKTMSQAIVDIGNINIWNAHAFLLLDAASDEKLEKAVISQLATSLFASTESVAGGPFHVLPAMLLLRRWEERLPRAAVDRIKEFFISGVIDRGNTENHWLMHYAGLLLAAERWSDEKQMWNGLSPQVVRAEAMRWISGMIDRSATTGHHEYDSTGYIAEHVTPLIGLAEHAQDAALREKARKMLAMHFTDMALEYFHGAWAGGHSREGYRVNTWTKSGTVRGVHYLYFGNEEFDPAEHNQGFVVPNLSCSYRPEALIVSMAFDRTRPVLVRKTKAPRTIFRHMDRESKPVRKYTYLSPSFALGSSQMGLPCPPAGPIDLVSWDLTWDGPKHHAKIVCNHPFRDPGRFSAFLPVPAKAAERDVGTGKPYLQWPDRLFGGSPYERLMQHKGTAVVLYRIPQGDRDPYVNLYLPKGLCWHERDGWLFSDVHNHERPEARFHLALYPIGPYDWYEIREAIASNIMVREGNLIDGWLLRIQDPNAGLVLEAVEAVGAGDSEFESFCKKRSSQPPDTLKWPDGGRVGFRTTEGAELVMNYDGPHLIDGEAVDYENWPLFDAPWVTAQVGEGKIRYEREGESLEIDFDIHDVDLFPMRSIG